MHGISSCLDKSIFCQWVELFIFETEEICQEFKFIIGMLDRFGDHMCYQALVRLAEQNIVAYALPADMSHRTQVLDYFVLSPLR